MFILFTGLRVSNLEVQPGRGNLWERLKHTRQLTDAGYYHSDYIYVVVVIITTTNIIIGEKLPIVISY